MSAAQAQDGSDLVAIVPSFHGMLMDERREASACRRFHDDSHA